MDGKSSKDLFPKEAVVDYDRKMEVKAFDESKAGVKGLVDGGVTKVPKMFIRPQHQLVEELNIGETGFEVPIIDLSGIHESHKRLKEVVAQVGVASEKWGFFQVVNHGIPSRVLGDMIEKTRMFHEQDVEIKKPFYSRDQMRHVRYECNYDLFQSRSANWRDTLNISMLVSDQLVPDEIPIVCRAVAKEYIEQVTKLGNTLLELLSEALGLKHDHFKALECGRGKSFVFHYYPACPEPDLTLGASKHTDPSFLTIVLQDGLGGLQVMHKNQWINVKPISGGLVVNIGDLLQMISNDKFKSVNHRVIANHVGPRISVASFFNGAIVPPKLYGPIKELTSEAYPPLYRDFIVSDYITKFLSKPLDESGLDQFKV